MKRRLTWAEALGVGLMASGAVLFVAALFLLAVHS